MYRALEMHVSMTFSHNKKFTENFIENFNKNVIILYFTMYFDVSCENIHSFTCLVFSARC